MRSQLKGWLDRITGSGMTRRPRLVPLARRPAHWARPAYDDQGPMPGVHVVSPTLWRGRQPDLTTLHRLRAAGVQTVLNLRMTWSDRALILASGLGYDHILLRFGHPAEWELLRFLRQVIDPRRAPVFVHCHHGSHRTGALCAAYRVVIEGWPPREAVREMVAGGYGWHPAWTGLVRWVMGLDAGSLRRRLGLPAGAGLRQPPRDTVPPNG